jgi:hypothetical protein
MLVVLAFLLMLVTSSTGAGAHPHLFSLDSDVTSSQKGGSALTVHRKQTHHGVGVEIELLSEGSETTAHVLAQGVAGCAVTVRQFARGSKTATVVEVLAPLGSRVSHAAHVSTGGHRLEEIRVGKTLVEVSHEHDGSVSISVWPDSGKTRWRASVSARLGDQQVLMHNTARVNKHTGALSAGFAVVLPSSQDKSQGLVVQQSRKTTRTTRGTTTVEPTEVPVEKSSESRHSRESHDARDIIERQSEQEESHHRSPPRSPKTRPRKLPLDRHSRDSLDVHDSNDVADSLASHRGSSRSDRRHRPSAHDLSRGRRSHRHASSSRGVTLSDSEEREMAILSDSSEGEDREERRKRRAKRRRAKASKATTTTTTTTTTTIKAPTTTTTKAATTTAKVTKKKETSEPTESDDEMGLKRTKTTVDLITKVSQTISFELFFFLVAKFFVCCFQSIALDNAPRDPLAEDDSKVSVGTRFKDDGGLAEAIKAAEKEDDATKSGGTKRPRDLFDTQDSTQAEAEKLALGK